MITLLERQSRASQVTLIRILVALGVVLLIENLALLSLFKDSAPPAMMLVANQIPGSPFLPSLSTKDNPIDGSKQQFIFSTLLPKLKQAKPHTSSTSTSKLLPEVEENGRQRILAIFEEAEITLNETMIAKLPTWQQVQDVVGEHPYIVGLEKCKEFRDTVPAVERMLGSAGMFNSGK
jgi:hypothetical protein